MQSFPSSWKKQSSPINCMHMATIHYFTEASELVTREHIYFYFKIKSDCSYHGITKTKSTTTNLVTFLNINGARGNVVG
jgi:hypothetical protein